MQCKPTRFINANISVELLERIKQEARNRSIVERRHVPYVELVRQALEASFPAPEHVRDDREILSG